MLQEMQENMLLKHAMYVLLVPSQFTLKPNYGLKRDLNNGVTSSLGGNQTLPERWNYPQLYMPTEGIKNRYKARRVIVLVEVTTIIVPS